MAQPAPRRRGPHSFSDAGPMPQRRGGGGGFRPKTPIVRWQALATGSLVGIAAWAFFYTLGAALWLSVVPGPSGTHATSSVMLGLYGGASASLALAIGAHVAARVGGVFTVENALLYGLCLWSFSTITLVGVAISTATNTMGVPPGGVGALFDVGLSAIGMLAGANATPLSTLWAMLATLVVSLAFALVGALRALPPER